MPAPIERVVVPAPIAVSVSALVEPVIDKAAGAAGAAVNSKPPVLAEALTETILASRAPVIVNFVLPVTVRAGILTFAVVNASNVFATPILSIVRDSRVEEASTVSSVKTSVEALVPASVNVIASLAPLRAVGLKLTSVSFGADLILISTGFARSVNVTASLPAIFETVVIPVKPAVEIVRISSSAIPSTAVSLVT